MRSLVWTFPELLDVWSVMRTEMVQLGESDLNADQPPKMVPNIFKCKNLAVLGRKFEGTDWFGRQALHWQGL